MPFVPRASRWGLWLLAVAIGVTIGLGLDARFTDGPLTNFLNLRGRTDENGYVRISVGTAGVTDGPLTTFGNLRARTDENGYLRVSCSGGGCGSGGGAPTDATYLTQTPDATLTNEQAMSALATGLVFNTTTTGVQSIYGGATCTNQVIGVLSAAGAATCRTITSSFVDTTVWTGTVSSGLLKASSQGVLAQASAGTDYQTPTGTPAGFVIASQATGDTLYASSATAWARRAIGNSGDVYTVAGGVPTWAAPSAGGLTVGTTAIASGTSLRVLYDNAGVLGEYTVTGSGTNLPLTAGTLAITSGKTLTALKTISLTAADDTGVYTLPTGTKTLLATDGSGASLTGIPTLGANTFTALQTITQGSANAGLLASTGYSLTGSNATNAEDFAGTWNTSGAPTLLKWAITDTASGTTSRYLSFLGGAAGATELFSFAKNSSATGVALNLGAAPNTFNYAGGTAWLSGAGPIVAFMPTSQKSWGFRASGVANGDFALFQGTGGGADPMAGTARLYMGATGGICVNCTTDNAAGTLSGTNLTATGTLRANTAISANGTAGQSESCGTTFTAPTFTFGILTASTCVAVPEIAQNWVLPGLAQLGYHVSTEDEWQTMAARVAALETALRGAHEGPR